MSETRFTDLTLSEPIILALQEIGYEKPTPVQENSIPLVAAGRDLMVQSQTGTGKTAAFGIPILEAIEPTKGIKSLILCPTRELAKQVADELERIGRIKQIRTVAIYGGASLEKQVAEMKFAHVVAGTPGRTLDHLKRGTLKLDQLQLMVLDEADEMLSMGFARELEDIMDYVPDQRQTLLFSATIPPDIKRYAKRYMNEPEYLSLIEENVASDDVSHKYFMVSGVGRVRDLLKVIEYENPESAIIFSNTRKETEQVAKYLKKHDLDVEYLNSDLSQRDRERVMSKMKTKSLRFLVATDIAARGIDISELSHVFNFVLPESPEVYIHRTGRTGRAGLKGTAISLIGPREIGVYYYLRRIYQVALEECPLPTKAEIELKRAQERSENLIAEIQDTTAETITDAERNDALKLLERDDAKELVARLLGHMRNASTSAPVKAPVVGGVLGDVPKPDHIAPGSLPQTLQGVASRVAIIRGEFRGVDKTQTTESSSAANDVQTKRAVSDHNGSAATSVEASAPKKTNTESKTSKPSSSPQAEAAEQSKAAPTAREARSKKTAPPKRTKKAEPKKTETTKAEEVQNSEPTASKGRGRGTSKTTRISQEAAPAKAAANEPPKSEPTKTTRTTAKTEKVEVKPSTAMTSAKASLKARLKRKVGSPPAQETVSETTPEKSSSGSAEKKKLSLKDRLANKLRRPASTTVESKSEPANAVPAEKPSAATATRQASKRQRETLEDGQIKLFINLGRKDGYNAKVLRELVAELGGLLPADIIRSSLRPRFSFITIEADYADDLIEALNGERVKGRLIRVERAHEDD